MKMSLAQRETFRLLQRESPALLLLQPRSKGIRTLSSHTLYLQLPAVTKGRGGFDGGSHFSHLILCCSHPNKKHEPWTSISLAYLGSAP